MEKFLLIDQFIGPTTIMDKTIASSIADAKNHFDNMGWVAGEVISEADYLIDMKNESDLNSLENQTYEG